MIRRFRKVLANERGGVLVFVAVSLGVVLGMSALAVDIGMLYTARSEAQRTADAAALAGASAFLESLPAAAVGPARDRAYEYALKNDVRKEAVDSADVETVAVNPAAQRVSVTIRRTGIPLWFARILGMNTGSVAATATAEAVQSGSATCIKPFVMWDLWYDKDNDNSPLGKNNLIWDIDPVNWDKKDDQTELWQYGSDGADRYQIFSGGDGDLQDTGYGSTFRNNETDAQGRRYTNDYGRQIFIKSNDAAAAIGPGNFFPWVMDTENLTKQCDIDPGGDKGAKTYAANICNCNTAPIELGKEYDTKPGNMIGPTEKGMEQLIKQDPDAYWDETAKTVKGSKFGNNFLASPRAVKVPLAAPGQDIQGRSKVVFNNFAILFIEPIDRKVNNKAPVTARFLFFAGGNDPDPGATNGTLVKTLRLVQ